MLAAKLAGQARRLFMRKLFASVAVLAICRIAVAADYFVDPAYTALSGEDQAKHAKSIVSILEKAAAYRLSRWRREPL